MSLKVIWSTPGLFPVRNMSKSCLSIVGRVGSFSWSVFWRIYVEIIDLDDLCCFINDICIYINCTILLVKSNKLYTLTSSFHVAPCYTIPRIRTKFKSKYLYFPRSWWIARYSIFFPMKNCTRRILVQSGFMICDTFFSSFCILFYLTCMLSWNVMFQLTYIKTCACAALLSCAVRD